MSAFQMGEWVLLTSQKGKKWLVRIEDAPFSAHLGGIKLADVVGKEEGDQLETTQGAKLFLFRASLQDYIYAMKRQTQIIYPKDLGAIIFYGDLYPGCTVLESGIGSGGLTLALLRAIGNRGLLVSIEKRHEFALLASENIRKFFGAPPENHRIVVADMENAHLDITFDRIFLDLPEPWRAVGNVSGMSSTGAILVSLSPNVGQVQIMNRELKMNGFGNIVHFELLQREWKIDNLRARPFDRMIAHTGFITVAKKVSARGEVADLETGEEVGRFDGNGNT